MLQFDPKMIQDMERGSPGHGDPLAVIVLDSDVAYVVCPHWCLVSLNPATFFSSDVHGIASLVEEGEGNLDWRILTAQDVQQEAKAFLAERGTAYLPIVPADHSYAHLEPSVARSTVETSSRSITGEGISISDAFGNGDALPIYPEQQGSGNRKAERYIFRIEDKVLALNGAYTRAFSKLGFEMTVPRERYGDHPVPPVGLNLPDSQGQVFGVLMAMNYSGIKEDDWGRKLYIDAVEASWMSEEEAFSFVRDANGYDPRKVLPDWSLDEALEEGGHCVGYLRRGVSALRWKGYDDADIEDLFQRCKEPAWVRTHEDLMEKAERAWERRNEGNSPWKRSNLQGSVQNMCGLLEALQRALNQKLDWGRLPDLVNYVEEGG